VTLKLILMRHAKSAWGDPSQDDFDRPLNGRGRSSSGKLGKWLADNGHLPGKVLVSGARRTVETWEHIVGHLPVAPQMESSPALYLGSAEMLLGVLQAQTDPTMLIIAHNPGIGDFAERMTNTAPTHEKFDKYPTGATTVLTFDAADWKDVTWRTGNVADFVVPREL